MNKLRLACLTGTAFEFFEFQIFAMMLPFLMKHFFGSEGPTATPFLGAYMTFGVAFLARPLGGFLLGYIGDHYGRRAALLVAMWLMALSTIAIGLLPGFYALGAVAGLLLLFCRVLQGLSLGGEFTSGSVFLFEHLRQPKCIDLIWLDLGGTTGLFFATLMVAGMTMVFTPEQIQGYAWRLPFLAAFFLSICGIYIRSSLSHTKTHVELIKQNRNRSISHYYRQIIGEWPHLLLLTLACAPAGIFWYLHVVFIPNQLLHLSALTLLPLIALTLVLIPVAAIVADGFGLYRTWVLSVTGLVLNFALLINNSSHTLQMLGMYLQSILLALNQGPRLFILTSSFPLAIRVMCCSLVYSVANILGGLTPFIALWLLNRSHQVQSLSQVLLGVCAFSITAMCLIKTGWAKREKILPAV